MTTKAIFSDDSEALVHYGVLGMKWGVRKDRYYDRGGRVAQAKLLKQEYQKKADVHSKRMHTIVDHMVDLYRSSKAGATTDELMEKVRKFEKENPDIVKLMNDEDRRENDPSKGEGLTKRQRKLYDKSNAAYNEHRTVATKVAEKVENNDYQRSDLKELSKAASKDLKATEKFAKSTGQMSKDGRSYIRARGASRIANPAHYTIGLGGALAAPVALALGQPAAAYGIGIGTGLATLGTSALNTKLSNIKSSTATQYHNDIAKANKNRKPIEAYG